MLTLYRSAMGKKVLMAVTGLMLFGFVLGHMAGNLKLYQGPEKMNAYAEWLRELGSPMLPHEGALWIARVGLLAAVGLHILSAWQLTRMSRNARPQGYGRRARVQATYASRTMRWGGVVILLFIVYHLMHLTFGNVHGGFVPGDVYHNVVSGFQVWPVSLFYIVAQVALAMHLYHGLWSLFQTLGLNQGGADSGWRKFALAFSAIVFLGNLSFPIAVLTGLVA